MTGEDIGETYAIFQDASKGISIIKINETTFKVQVIKIVAMLVVKVSLCDITLIPD